MTRPKEFKTKKTYIHRMDRKANESPLIFARVGDGGGAVATGRTNFYQIRLINDNNRLTQCHSLIPLANNDWIYVRESKDRKLRYYEFAAFIQDAFGGTAPPIQTHDHSAAGEGGQLDWDDIWIDAVHTHANAAEGGQLDWDNIWTDAVHDHSSAAEGGQALQQIQDFNFDDATILTIGVGGDVTRTQVYHIIAANAGVADDLDNVLGGVEGDELIIRPDAGDTITCRHNQGGAGDFWFAGGADIVLDNQDHLRCVHDGTSWCDQSGGAGGLGDHTHSAPGDGGATLAAHTVTGNVDFDDGVGDSPAARFVGGSNNDTALIFLKDDAIAGQSDLYVNLPGNAGLSTFVIADVATTPVFYVTDQGDVGVFKDIYMADDHWIGRGAANCRLVFDSTPAVDLLWVANAVLTIDELGATPANPAANKWKIYPKADGFYQLDDAGNEEPLTAKGVAVYNDAVLVIPTGAWTVLTFNSERWDDADFHSVLANTGRLTCPDGLSGWYMIAGNFYFTSSGAGTYRQGALRLNGATWLQIYAAAFSAAFNSYVMLSTVYYLSDNGVGANDYVELQAIQDTGGNLNVPSTGNYSPEFRMVRI